LGAKGMTGDADCLRGDYDIKTDVTAFDFIRVHDWLSNDAYWSPDIPLNVVERAFSNSLAFGLFHAKQGQVGVARMITDRATFAYLADVYIDPQHRGQGLAIWLMETIMAHTELQGLRRMMLATSDMHALYRKFGYTKLANPEIIMEQVKPDIYK
jgi:GNAT superfamily N-acetyltransferase